MTKINNERIIGFDMDGVLVDHTAMRLKLAAEHGWKLAPEQTPAEIFNAIIPEPVLENLKHALYSDPEVSLLAPLMPGAKTALEEIKKRGIPYVLISKRKNPEAATNLLKARGLWPDYFNEENAFFVVGSEGKNPKAVELGITHYVDDEIGILEKLPDVEHKFLFDHLGVFDGVDSYKRVTSWPELMKHLV